MRARAEPDLRCPWCRSVTAGARCFTCPRDGTPLHADCLREFGLCPVCRLAIGPRVEVEPLPPCVAAALARLERDHAAPAARSATGWTLCAALGAAALSPDLAITVALAGVTWLAAVFARAPRATARALEGPDRALAERIASEDARALRALERYGALDSTREVAEAARARLVAWAEERPALMRALQG